MYAPASASHRTRLRHPGRAHRGARPAGSGAREGDGDGGGTRGCGGGMALAAASPPGGSVGGGGGSRGRWAGAGVAAATAGERLGAGSTDCSGADDTGVGVCRAGQTQGRKKEHAEPTKSPQQ